MSKVWETPIFEIMHKEFVQCDKKFNYNDVRAQRNLLPAFVKFNNGLTARQRIESELGGAGANWIHLQVDDGKWVVPAFCSWIQCMPESYFNCQHCSNPCSKITIGDHWATCGEDAPVLD
ncbi:uncharacterized protein LOC114323589 isoform X3 [Camellia sinensis]|uniref:uncharacterized protein LOC114323589 isoform X3 n=1 Tax=Camellia sinensis TaxID=4442 RepID=UPI001035BE33|nr:uncharacterized protein LOC114323589 isoform X3 [Camellia sinensis]